MKLKFLLFIHIALFFILAIYFYINKKDFDSEFYLDTIPVDPRDFISGTYVRLNYKTEADASECLKKFENPVYRYFYFKFSPSNQVAKIKDSDDQVVLYKVVDCSPNPVYEKDWAKIYVIKNRNNRVEFQMPSKFYLSEKDNRKNIQSGKAIAKVKIQKNKMLAIVDLLEKE